MEYIVEFTRPDGSKYETLTPFKSYESAQLYTVFSPIGHLAKIISRCSHLITEEKFVSNSMVIEFYCQTCGEWLGDKDVA